MSQYHPAGWINELQRSPQGRRTNTTKWILLNCCLSLIGCGSYERSAAENNAIATIRNQGGYVTVNSSDYVRIDFTQMGVDDAGLVPLVHLTRLEMLLLAGTDVSDAGMKHLSGATSLRHLSLKGTQIGDAGLAHLGGLTGLRELDLGETQITDAGLVSLHGLKQLEKLYVDNTAVTNAGLRELEEALPQLTIFGPH